MQEDRLRYYLTLLRLVEGVVLKEDWGGGRPTRVGPMTLLDLGRAIHCNFKLLL